MYQLQCGRGPKPTEIISVIPTHPSGGPASMWPRAEAHGNKGGAGSDMNISLLQCGRGPKPTEICAAACSFVDASMLLQCGRGPKPTEIPRDPGDYLRQDKASMWPRAEAHGNDRSRPMAAVVITLQCGRGPKPTEIERRTIVLDHHVGFNVAAGRSPRKSGLAGDACR